MLWRVDSSKRGGRPAGLFVHVWVVRVCVCMLVVLVLVVCARVVVVGDLGCSATSGLRELLESRRSMLQAQVDSKLGLRQSRTHVEQKPAGQ